MGSETARLRTENSWKYICTGSVERSFVRHYEGMAVCPDWMRLAVFGVCSANAFDRSGVKMFQGVVSVERQCPLRRQVEPQGELGHTCKRSNKKADSQRHRKATHPVAKFAGSEFLISPRFGASDGGAKSRLTNPQTCVDRADVAGPTARVCRQQNLSAELLKLA